MTETTSTLLNISVGVIAGVSSGAFTGWLIAKHQARGKYIKELQARTGDLRKKIAGTPK